MEDHPSKTAGKKKKSRLISWLLVFALLAGGFWFLGSRILYRKAAGHAEDGQYDRARSEFARLAKFRGRWREMDSYLLYIDAGECAEEQEYGRAIALYEELGGFLDSSERGRRLQSMEEEYRKGTDALSSGSDRTAYLSFRRCADEDYRDSREQAEKLERTISSAAKKQFGSGNAEKGLEILDFMEEQDFYCLDSFRGWLGEKVSAAAAGKFDSGELTEGVRMMDFMQTHGLPGADSLRDRLGDRVSDTARGYFESGAWDDGVLLLEFMEKQEIPGLEDLRDWLGEQVSEAASESCGAGDFGEAARLTGFMREHGLPGLGKLQRELGDRISDAAEDCFADCDFTEGGRLLGLMEEQELPGLKQLKKTAGKGILPVAESYFENCMFSEGVPLLDMMQEYQLPGLEELREDLGSLISGAAAEHFDAGEIPEGFWLLNFMEKEDLPGLEEQRAGMERDIPAAARELFGAGRYPEAVWLLGFMDEQGMDGADSLRRRMRRQEMIRPEPGWYGRDWQAPAEYRLDLSPDEAGRLFLEMMQDGELARRLPAVKGIRKLPQDELAENLRVTGSVGQDFAEMIMPDYASIMWISGYDYGFRRTNDGKLRLSWVEYTLDKEVGTDEEARRDMALVDRFCSELITAMNEYGLLGASMDRQQRAAAVFDMVCFFMNYCEDGEPSIYNTAETIRCGRGVCTPFTALYNRLCNMAGVPTWGCSVRAAPDGDENAEGDAHICSVQEGEDGTLYFSDVTWGDETFVSDEEKQTMDFTNDPVQLVQNFLRYYMDLFRSYEDMLDMGGVGPTSKDGLWLDNDTRYFWKEDLWKSHRIQNDLLSDAVAAAEEAA